MKPKVALVKSKFIDPVSGKVWAAGDENCRGRISLPAVAHLTDLASKGWDIDGYVVTRSVSTPAKPTAEAVVTKSTVSTVKTVADIGAERYDSAWEAFYTFDGKRHNVELPRVCNTCHSSLSYHKCNNPVVWHDYQTEVVVSLRQKKS